MKLTTLFLLLSCSCTFSQQFGLRSPAFVAGLNVGAAAPGSSYDFEETFEGTGYATPVIVVGTTNLNPDEATVVVSGTHSCSVSNTASSGNYLQTTNITTTGSAGGYFLFRATSTPAANRIFATFYNGSTSIGSITFRTTTNLSIQQGSYTTTATPAVLELNTWYNIWWEIGPESSEGANDGYSKIAFTNYVVGSNPKPTSGDYYRERLNGSAVETLQSLRFGMTSDVMYYVDRVIMDDDAVAGNP